MSTGTTDLKNASTEDESTKSSKQIRGEDAGHDDDIRVKTADVVEFGTKLGVFRMTSEDLMSGRLKWHLPSLSVIYLSLSFAGLILHVRFSHFHQRCCQNLSKGDRKLITVDVF